MPRSRSPLLTLPLLILLAACAPPRGATGATGTAGTPPVARAAIVVSYDSFNERRIRETIGRDAAPTLYALFDEGRCADWAQPAFPSVTAAGHAALWTGAYGDVTGVSANSQPALPRGEHALTEMVSGFHAARLRAEPIWITAGRTGAVVTAHHVTQAPWAPGYPAVDGDPEELARMARKRADADSVLARPNLRVVNGYNRALEGARLLTEREAPPRAPGPWRNYAAPLGVADDAWPAITEAVVPVGTAGDSLFLLFHGPRVLIAPSRDGALGVVADARPLEQSSPVGDRPLARHFSLPLRLRTRDGDAMVRFRLFRLAGSGPNLTFQLYHPGIPLIDASEGALLADYIAAAGGWTGNSGIGLLERGRFGAPLWQGGDGSAERAWLETAELAAVTAIAGSRWMWQTFRPRLHLDYLALGDDTDHALYGFVRPDVPGHDPQLAAQVQEVRRRAWGIVDRHLAALRAMATERGAVVAVAGDHGMRPVWRRFRPNVALAQAGLLHTVRDSTVRGGWRLDLSRTQALTPNGYWVMLNRAAWKGGIVTPAQEAEVLAAAERALLAARGDDGQPVVTRIWRARDGHDSLGIGGPAGGDLYYEVAPGYGWTAEIGGRVTDRLPRPNGSHGFPSVAPDMRTVFCGVGAGLAPGRIGPARSVDVAPTVAAWLGLPAPPQSVGRARW